MSPGYARSNDENLAQRQADDNAQSNKSLSLDRLNLEVPAFSPHETGDLFDAAASSCHYKKRQRSVSDPTSLVSLKQPPKSFSGSFRAVPYPAAPQQGDGQHSGLKYARGQPSGHFESVLQEAANKLDLTDASDLRRKIFPRLADSAIPHMKFRFSAPYRECCLGCLLFN